MNRPIELPSVRAARGLAVPLTLILLFVAAAGLAPVTRGVTAIASDTFSRTVASGWGTLDTGQTWYIPGGNDAAMSVGDGVGKMEHTTIGELEARALGVSVADVNISAKFRAQIAADASVSSQTEFILYTRVEPEPYFRYYLRLVLSFVVGSPSPVLRVDRHAITYTQGIATAALPTTYNDPTVAWMLRFETVGTSIRGRAWPASQSEPSTWQIDMTDDQVTAANQFTVGTFTNDVVPAMTIEVDDLTVTAGTAPPGPPFTDIDGSLFKSDIIWLWESGITKGCTLTTFCPDDPVTRGQMAAFLVRALSLPGTATDYFTDDDGITFEDDINRLAASGITKGCGPTTYCPDATITREQMAAFLDRALGLPATGTDYFTDDEASIFEANINRLAASGITKGCTATTYCPALDVTRGQMAAFLHRGLTL